MRRLLLGLIATLALAGSAEAANRFWVPITVTGAANNGSGLCRIQVGAGLATGKVTGETVTVAGVTGATGCNVTTTITAIDATHIDLVGTTFGGAYVNGGTVAGGTWNATNIGNWGTSSGTGSGAAIPGSADNATFDGASGGAPVTVAANIGGTNTINTFTWGAFTSTLDFDTNNVSITVTGSPCMSGTGTGASRKFLSAGATFTCTLTTVAAGLVTMQVTTSLDAASDFSAAWVFTGSNAANRGVQLGALTSWGAFTVGTNASNGSFQFFGGGTLASLAFTGPGLLIFPSATTTTITGAFAWTGNSVGTPSLVAASSPGSAATIHASAASTMDKMSIRDLTFNTSTVTITNGYDFGGNTGTYTLTNPAGGGGGIIGGGS